MKVRKKSEGDWRKMKLKLGQKINLIVIVVIVFLSAVVGFYVVRQVSGAIKLVALEKAKGDLSLGESYIDIKYPGDWHIKNGELYKGNVRMNENFEIVDEIAEKTGDTVTIFQGNTRIATNVTLEDGQRAVGTQVSDEVADVVINNKEIYFGEANVVGKKYISGYKPIFDNKGEVIGIFYVGAPQNVIDETIGSFLKMFVIVFIVANIIAFLIVVFFTRRLNRRLTNLSTALKKAEEGDFTYEIVDQVGDELTGVTLSFQSMRKSMQKMIQKLVDVSDHLHRSSKELSEGASLTKEATEQITLSIQEVVNGAEAQATSVEETSITMEEVATGMNNLAENASVISDFAQHTRKQATDGNALIEKTVKQMDMIHHSVNESSEAIRLLDERSKSIGDITKTISDISNQTNLLALNAAIEAARAGEHGKGFAVVAEEVQKLAVQTQESSTQISQLIEAIKNDMIKTFDAMEHVRFNVSEGIGIVSQTEENFTEIVKAMEKMDEQISSTAATAEQVSASIQQVSSAIARISEVSRNTSAHTQNVSASTEEQLASMDEILNFAKELAQLSSSLRELISNFKIN